MDRRNDGATAALTFHSHLIDDLAGTDRACGRILEETTSGARTVRLRSEPAALHIVHALLDAVGFVGCQTQSCTKQQLAFAERRAPVVPLDAVARNLRHLSCARDAHGLGDGADLVTESARVHPECTADRSRNSTETFDSGKTGARDVDAQAWQRVTRAHRNAIIFDPNLAFHLTQTQNDVVMIVIVGKDVASRSQRTPTDTRLVQLMNNRRRLLFGFRRDDPIDRTADAQAGEFCETASAFGAHAEPRGDLFERLVAFRQFLLFYFAQLESRKRFNNWSLTRFTVPAPSVNTRSPDCTRSRNAGAAFSSSPM